MIQAILRNKISREARDYFKAKEDTLTSSVIGNLLFLPDKLFLEILSSSSEDSLNLDKIGKLQSYEFWPRWDSSKTTNKNYVEPDVFLQYEKTHIIIEAKRYDDFQQNPEEWKREITAYYNEYKDEEKKLILLAIGGINKDETETIFESKETKIYKIRWIKILKKIESILKYRTIEIEANGDSIKRILQVTLQGFELHGFLTIKWFEEMNNQYSIENYQIKNWKPN